MLSSKTIGNADTEHLGELTQIPTSEYSTHTAISCRPRIKCFLHHNCTFTRTGGSVILTNKRKYALQERKMFTQVVNVCFCAVLSNRGGSKLSLSRWSPSCFFPLPSILEAWLKTSACRTYCLREETDCGTSSTVFFQVSQVCAWILSGWQMSSICTSIPWLCWQVCLHNYFFFKTACLRFLTQ